MIRRMTPTGHPAAAAHAADVLEIFDDHRAIHAYGIVDVAQFWDSSRWWVCDRGVVGLVGLPAVPDGVVYAISAVHAAATVALLTEIVDELPAQFPVTGPSGLAERMEPTHRATRVQPYIKMQLIRPDRLPAPGPDVKALGPDDADGVLSLLAQTGGAAEFVRLDLLGTGRHFGTFDGDTLVAMAGTHLVDAEQNIAAIGSVNTLPEYRGRGLARHAVAALTNRLREEVEVIALNVGRDNTPARNLYEGLGFLPLMEYEEAELVRR
ncbi:hypothetical protein BH23ACT10_BH23ACT10_26740 [soil metagenome]